MNQHERDRLAMTERSICEGEKQNARLSETIRELERKGNTFAAARARKLLEDFQYDLNLAALIYVLSVRILSPIRGPVSVWLVGKGSEARVRDHLP